MTLEERIKEHLIDYKKSNALNQQEMANLLEVGVRTYQEIEGTGSVPKSKDLISIIVKTGFDPAHLLAGSGIKSLKESLEDFATVTKNEIAGIKIILRALAEDAMNSRSSKTGQTRDAIAQEFAKQMKKDYKQFLGE